MKQDFLQLADEYTREGNLNALEELTHKISATDYPAEQKYVTACLDFLKGKLSEALGLCEKILPITSKNKVLLCKVLLLKSRVLQREGEYVASNRNLDRCFTVMHSKDTMLGDIWNAKGVNYWMLGKLERAKRCYRKASYLSKKSNNTALFLKSSINLGIVPLRQGNFFEAKVYLHNALKLCEHEHATRLQIYAMLNIGELCWQNGEWKVGQDILTKCRHFAQEAGLNYEEGAAYWIHGSILRDEHAYDKAAEYYRKSLNLLERSMSYTEKIYVYLNMGVMARLQGNYKLALEQFNKAQTTMNETGEKLDEGYLLMEMAFSFWLLGEKQSAQTYLRRGIEKTLDRKYEYTTGRFIQYYIQKQKGGDYLKGFDSLLKVCWKHGYDTILMREREFFLPIVCEYALKRKRAVLPRMLLLRLVTSDEGLIDFLMKHKSLKCQEIGLSLVEKLGLEHYKNDVQECIWHLKPSIAKKAVSVLESLEHKAVPYLKIRLFGRFEIFRDGSTRVLIARKKAQDLFKILLLNNQQNVLRDKLMEMLWPGERPEKSFSSLRQVIFLLRKSLHEYGFDAENMIHREVGIYEFRYPTQWLDIDLFRFNDIIEQGDKQWRDENTLGAVELYEKAFDLYRGPLLAENLYDAWNETYRLEARDRYARIVARIMNTLLLSDKERAGEFIQTAIKKDPEISVSTHR
ncbi:MAG: BTAD domain-containing putative transcriptional regulator [bacterium]